MAWPFKHVYWFNPQGTSWHLCNGKTQHEKKQTVIGRALCGADWLADWLTGSLASCCGVFLVCSWNGERHGVRRMLQGG